jgi:putative hemin transport protein
MNDTAGVSNGAAVSADMVARIREAIRKDPGQMTMQLARELDVPEAEIVRLMPNCTALDTSRWEELIRALEPLGSVHVIVSNGATTLEAVGAFGGFSTWGPFFNVQTDSLDMHIRYEQLASVFAVEKPSHLSGVSTLSVQFYDRAGNVAFKVFLNFGGKASAETISRFAQLREQFRKSE